MQYGLSSPLQRLYQPYINQQFDPSFVRQRDWQLRAAYMDLMRYENELRHAKHLTDLQRRKLWQERQQFQALSEAERRARWWRMKAQERALLGLAPSRYFGNRYGSLGRGYGSVVRTTKTSGANASGIGLLVATLIQGPRSFVELCRCNFSSASGHF